MGLQKVNIVLIGMMGAGKSTVGRLLAERLGFTFLDTDEEIESMTGKKINQIFVEKGEIEFRKLERELVMAIVNKDKQVIATGGGVVLDHNNIRLLKENGLIVHLFANFNILIERLNANTTRPLLNSCNPYDKLQEILKDRRHLYHRSAHLEIDTSNLTPEQVVDELIERIEIM